MFSSAVFTVSNAADTLGVQKEGWENGEFTQVVEYYITKLLKEKKTSSVNGIKTECKY